MVVPAPFAVALAVVQIAVHDPVPPIPLDSLVGVALENNLDIRRDRDPPFFTTTTRVTYRQPLLRGFGREPAFAAAENARRPERSTLAKDGRAR